MKTMKNVIPKNNNNFIIGKVPKVGTGHIPHKSGSGKHKSKFMKRLGNRSQQQQKSINEC
jgi:hypothetical protein